MSRIVIWSPNYAPEPIGIPPLVTDAAEWLAARRHEIDVVTAVPNYPERRIDSAYRGRYRVTETRNGVRVHRHWIRVRPEERFLDKALYEATFALSSLPTYLAHAGRADAIVCLVPSLAAAALATRLPRRARLVLWVQDLVASAARAVDGAPPAPLAAAARAEGRTVRRADHVVVCSPGFAAALGIEAETILNWVDTDAIRPRPMHANGRQARFLYAGNLGYTQGFETLVDAARLAGGVELELVGAGNAAARVRALAEGVATVRPPVPRSDFEGLLGSADVHVVLQRRVSAGANLPSKIASYLASGRPIVASIALDTPAADLLRDSGGALLVPPEEPVALAEAMARLRDDRRLRERLAAKGREYAERRLGKDQALARLERAILG